MSKIDVTLYRTEDHRILKVLFASDYEKDHEYHTLSFKCNTESMTIISTSAGSIDGEGNAKLTEPTAELFVDYCESSSELECLIGYYQNNELLDYETLTAYFDNTQAIKTTEITIPNSRTIPGSFEDRFEDFFSALLRRKSSWKVQVSCQDDVFLDIVSRSNAPATVIFGENTREVLASDYIFRLEPETHKLNIPIEVIRKKSQKYTPRCQLGVFEVIEPDFLGAQGVFYKSLISNLITMSDIAKAL